MIKPDAPFDRCWHETNKQMDCWNVRTGQCAHCKWLYCEQHLCYGHVGGARWQFCLECHAMLFGEKKRE